jgi:DNA-binding FadR family transcriptional regulator
MTSLVKELESSRKPVLDEKQMESFEVADLAFHTYLMKLAGNRKAMKVIGGIRLLIRIFAARRGGHNLATLKQISRDHTDLLTAIQAGEADNAVACIQRHISQSRRGRLEEFDQREREAALPQNIDDFLNEIRSELV